MTMRAAYVVRFAEDDPLAGLEIGERPEPTSPEPTGLEQTSPELAGRAPAGPEPVASDDWVVVEARAASLNHHDLWSLRGVGLAPHQLPMILGSDVAGIGPDGEAVVGYPVIPGATGDGRAYSLLSEHHQGTLAQRVALPRRNLLPKPPELSFEQAACLPTAWLTAYRMLVGCGRLQAGDAVLVQGAGGGVATAAVALARLLSARPYVTSRSAERRERIAALGATAVEPGARLPERVDVVIETVGAATFDHSLKCAKAGARIVVAGATSGHLAQLNLRRVFALGLQILGTSMGTREDLQALLELCATRGARPIIDSVFGFEEIPAAFARLASGEAFGKIVIRHDH